MSNVPIIAGTLQTDPRSGGQTKKSGVNPLPIIAESKSGKNWAEALSQVVQQFLLSQSNLFATAFSWFSLLAWAEIRDDNNKEVDWLIAGYENGSKTDIGLVKKGKGGLEACAKELPEGEPVFGGCRLNKKGRFVSFYYCDEGISAMKKGRASMHKNGKPFFFVFSVGSFVSSLIKSPHCCTCVGVLNVLQGCDGEIKIQPNMTEDDIESIF